MVIICDMHIFRNNYEEWSVYQNWQVLTETRRKFLLMGVKDAKINNVRCVILNPNHLYELIK